MSMEASKRATSHYWNRRMNRDAAPPTLVELLAELNRELAEDPAFLEGTRFVLKRTGSGTELPTWEGPAEARALIHRVLQTVTAQFSLPVPFQMDGVPGAEAVQADEEAAAGDGVA